MRPMELPIEIVRSRRRKRTIAAYVVDGRVRVLLPAGMPAAQEASLVEEMAAKAIRRFTSKAVDLSLRASQLADRYGFPHPESIAWSDRQLVRWGSCTPGLGSIRISRRLASMPPWVLDWVLVHELAHLVVGDHGPRFQALVSQYELGERAEGYLIAKSEEQVSRP
ncbi:M48 family metallopeptidase [soil metagenome]